MAQRISHIFSCPDVFSRLAAAAGAGLVNWRQTGVGAAIRDISTKLTEIINVEDFVSPSDVDDTARVQRATAALVVRGGGTLWFKHGKEYTFWTAGESTVMALNGANHVTLAFNGCSIVSANPAPTAGNAVLIDNHGVDGLRIEGLNFTGSNTTLTSTVGERFIYGHDGSNNTVISNCTINDCYAGLFYALGTTRNHGVLMSAVTFNRVYYPFGTYRTDDIDVTYAAINCGRSFTCANPANNVKVNLYSQHGGPFSDMIFGINAVAVADGGTVAHNTIANVEINYNSPGRYVGSGNQDLAEGIIVFNLNQANTNNAAGNYRNVKVNFSVNAESADKPSNILLFRRYTSAGSGDNSTARVHTVRNFTISGSARQWNNSRERGIVLFTKTDGGATVWTNDLIDSIALNDVHIGGVPSAGQDAIYVNGQGAVASTPFLTLKNVVTDGPLTYDSVSATTARVSESNVKSSNLDAADGHGTWTPADGSGAGLSLTVTSATWWKRGREYGIYADVTYPATASGLNAVISGAPFFGSVNVIGSGSYGSLPMTPVMNTLGNMSILLPTAGIATNANLTGATVRLSVIGRLA